MTYEEMKTTTYALLEEAEAVMAKLDHVSVIDDAVDTTFCFELHDRCMAAIDAFEKARDNHKSFDAIIAAAERVRDMSVCGRDMSNRLPPQTHRHAGTKEPVHRDPV